MSEGEIAYGWERSSASAETYSAGEIEAAARAMHRTRYYPRDLWETDRMAESSRESYRREALAALMVADWYRAFGP